MPNVASEQVRQNYYSYDNQYDGEKDDSYNPRDNQKMRNKNHDQLYKKERSKKFAAQNQNNSEKNN